MSELKPCPFCGAQPFWDVEWGLTCTNQICQANTKPSTSEEEAISAWNTRASDARIAELEAEVERLRAQSETMRNILQEADKRIVWEHHGLGHDFTDRVEDALND